MGRINYGGTPRRGKMTPGVERALALHARLLRASSAAKYLAVKRRLCAWLERATPREEAAYYRALVEQRRAAQAAADKER